MASIEIDSNTIIKLLARRGSDLDRKNVILAEGELGYVVDLKRLYVGDGVTPGGIPTSIKFHNTTTNITSIPEAIQVNDLVYKSDTNEIYKLVSGDGSTVGDWELISSPTYVSVDDATIGKTTPGVLYVKEISGAQISNNAIGNSIDKVSNKISLSGSISIDKIALRDASSLTIPSSLTLSNNFNTVTYNLPQFDGLNKYHLVTDGFGNLSWEAASFIERGEIFLPNLSVPVGTVIFYAVSAFIDPPGWLICDGRSLIGTDYPDLSSAIGTTYGGDSTNFNLPNYMNGGMLYGADISYSGNSIGTTSQVLCSYSLAVGLTGSSMTSLSDTLSTFAFESFDSYIGHAGTWLIKYQADRDITTQINIPASGGLSAFNVDSSQATTTITLCGTYDLGIDTGAVGTGNEKIVEGYRKARAPQMFTYAASGTYSYTVSNNVYRLKVTATGAGGVGYIKYNDLGYWRANGTQGGAGSSIIAYIDVEPGETYRIDVGAAGLALRSPLPLTEVYAISAGWGEGSSVSLSAGATITSLITAGGGYDPVYTDSATPYYADWSRNGEARGGYKGGEVFTPSHSKVVSYVHIKGGDGGQFLENGADGPGASSMWGSGPAPGGGGSGHARSDSVGVEVAKPGDGIVIIEEL